MSKNYLYRMQRDTGFAPHPHEEICFLSGCKKTTVERCASEGSWIIGIGGIRTGQKDKIIYLMRVLENLTFNKFQIKYGEKNQYLRSENAGSNVLVSKEFYYFGDHAVPIPDGLEHIKIDREGCKCVSDSDVNRLIKSLNRHFNMPGIYGNPNNPTDE